MKKITTAKEHRAANGRTAESRAMHLRNIQNMDYHSVLYIDPAIVPEGMDYAWATITVLGVPRPGRLIELRQVGWEIVPADRHPDLAFAGASKGSIANADHIERTGLVLIERPTEYGEIERKLRADKDYNNLVNMPGMEQFMSEPGIPGTNTGGTYMTQTREGAQGRVKNASFGN